MGAGPVRRSFSKGGCNFTEMLWDYKIEFRNYYKLIQNNILGLRVSKLIPKVQSHFAS
jgi:hypothetical protein